MSSQLEFALILSPLKGAKNEIDRCSHSNSSDGKQQQHIRVFEKDVLNQKLPQTQEHIDSMFFSPSLAIFLVLIGT